MKYVRESDLSLAEVSFLLGYANPPAFTLAFKRWTGKAPSELRANLTVLAADSRKNVFVQ